MNNYTLLDKMKRYKVRLASGAAALLMMIGIGSSVKNYVSEESEIPNKKIEEHDPSFQPKKEYDFGDGVVGIIDETNPIVKPEDEVTTPIVDTETTQDKKDTEEVETPSKGVNTVKPVRPVLDETTKVEPGTTTEEPSITPEIEHTEHTFGEWTYDSEDMEVRTCSVCGEKEFDTHSYVETGKRYFSTRDGFHYEVTYSECETCHHKDSEVKKVECTYGESTFDDENEYKTCKVCGYTLVKPKTVTPSAPSVIVKPVRPGNGGGSHGGGNHGGSTIPVHKHSFKVYGSTEYITMGDPGHKEVTHTKCECGEIGQDYVVYKDHLSKEECTNVVNDGINITYRCTCGHVVAIEKVKEEHKHIYTVTEKVVIDNEDGTHTIVTTETCTAPGCSETEKVKTTTVKESCTGAETVTICESVGEAGHNITKKTTGICPVCEHDFTYVSEPELVEHNLINSTDEKGHDIVECSDECGYKLVNHAYEAYTNVTSNHDGTHTIETGEKCSICDLAKEDTVSTNTVNCNNAGTPFYEVTNPGENGTHTMITEYNCDVCGVISQSRKEENHNHSAGTPSYTSEGANGHEVSTTMTCVCNDRYVDIHTESHNMVDDGDRVGRNQPTKCSYDCGYTSHRVLSPEELKDLINQAQSQRPSVDEITNPIESEQVEGIEDQKPSKDAEIVDQREDEKVDAEVEEPVKEEETPKIEEARDEENDILEEVEEQSVLEEVVEVIGIEDVNKEQEEQQELSQTEDHSIKRMDFQPKKEF